MSASARKQSKTYPHTLTDCTVCGKASWIYIEEMMNTRGFGFYRTGWRLGGTHRSSLFTPVLHNRLVRCFHEKRVGKRRRERCTGFLPFPEVWVCCDWLREHPEYIPPGLHAALPWMCGIGPDLPLGQQLAVAALRFAWEHSVEHDIPVGIELVGAVLGNRKGPDLGDRVLSRFGPLEW